jgi:hypothetical protein
MGLLDKNPPRLIICLIGDVGWSRGKAVRSGNRRAGIYLFKKVNLGCLSPII